MELSGRLLRFELRWQTQGLNGTVQQTLQGQAENLQNILGGVVLNNLVQIRQS